MKSLWFEDKTLITTYTLEELLGTKLRALYQRKKGRDLFDLAMALEQFPSVEISNLLRCFEHYMDYVATKISRAEFEENLSEKLKDIAFLGDIKPLLPYSINSAHDPLADARQIQNKIISLLPGEAWKGKYEPLLL
jgi:hypothetical protein